MKTLSLAFAVIFSISSSFAQTTKTQRSCKDQLIQSKTKVANAFDKVGSGSFLGVAGAMAFSLMMFESMGDFFITLPVAVVGTTVLGIQVQNRKTAIAIFEGAANGGNEKTDKLWRKANRIAPETFGKYSYQDFLNEIHEADVSGKACKTDIRPSKRKLIKLIGSELEQGETSETEDEAISDEVLDTKEVVSGEIGEAHSNQASAQ
jgi:hypothetical protein